ncbi:hypothetical protein K466DRAFT_204567 [Polyporus arcularius HHB13444]|uniref:Uncharacterized protein n=1 Tax=Polyporus arcularius HHB13444 TaxID=1314778 RepID=A0A5C3P6B5_9APHY|nr:hypothetical protein K466DRAFT_204567 [Polyporus arcularius HHB13444]
MIDVLGALMGLDMQGFSREEGSDELPPGVNRADVSSPPPTATSPPPQPAASSSKSPEPTPAKDEDVEMLDEEEAAKKREAEAEKKLGAEAYKTRDFDNAIAHFQKAWDTYPKDITFLTNLAAAYFEKGDYDETIKTCEKAVDEGRELRADFKLIAKAYGRIAGGGYRRGEEAHEGDPGADVQVPAGDPVAAGGRERGGDAPAGNAGSRGRENHG